MRTAQHDVEAHLSGHFVRHRNQANVVNVSVSEIV